MTEHCICKSIGDGEVLRNSQCKAHDSGHNMRPDILTRGGQYFNFLDPSAYRLDIKDIAHGLSNICRFGGHTREFYSVAQHSIYLSHIVPEEDAYAGLMHDCAEAFLGDIPSPLKRRLPDYKRIESIVEAALFEKLGIPFPLPASVKNADLVMLATEQAFQLNRSVMES